MQNKRGSYAYSVARVDHHPMIEAGLYKAIRHSGSVGQVMIDLGISISLSNCLSIVAMLLPIAPGYGYRINVEERFMSELHQIWNNRRKNETDLYTHN
jgi:protein-S-isoprenylcysteine O-methyltransferase Ste14